MTRNTIARNTMPSIHQIADYFLYNVDASAGDSITNLKLQKLCYFAQAVSLAERSAPIFDEKIEAWAHGPVVPALYRRFKKYRWDAIDPTDTKRHQTPLNGTIEPVLSKVWLALSPFSAKQLEKITHQHEPWRKAYGDRPLGARCDEEITIETMKAFYRQEEQKKWWNCLVKHSKQVASASRV